MPLADLDKERIRYHLGYLEVQGAASIQFGIPRPLQTVFLLEEAMSNVIDNAIPRIQRIVRIMDQVEEKLCGAQDRLAAKQLDSLILRDNEGDQLEHEYRRWGYRLADILGVPIYPYSMRYRAGVKAGNIPVS